MCSRYHCRHCAVCKCRFHEVVAVEAITFYSEEELAWLNAARINGISLSDLFASSRSSVDDRSRGYELCHTRERQLHVALRAVPEEMAREKSSVYPAAYSARCATATSSNGCEPLRVI